jgi:carbon starvation protein CstA
MKDFLEWFIKSQRYLGTIGGTIAILGVIVSITSGDTSFRAARMITDYLKIDQKALKTVL